MYWLSAYALPVSIALVSLVALVYWQAHYPQHAARQLEFQVTEESAGALTPQQAWALLEGRPHVQHNDSRLSERPFWVRFASLAEKSNAPLMVEFPSRHAMEISCWEAATWELLGHGAPQATTGGISAVKAGFALTLGVRTMPANVICRTRFVGPARFTAIQWTAPELQASAQEFHRNSGLLDGGLIVLALFVLIAALINRQSDYVVFAAWLLVNLRVAALSAGWDTQWLGHTVPPDWVLRMRLLTIAVYYAATITLFRALFREDLARVGYAALLRFAQWTCLPILLLAMVLPFRSFLPVIWISTGINIIVLVFFLVRIIMLTRSPVAIWYGASIGITLFASLYEVISAALGVKGLIGAVNSVTAALSSSLLAALAIAEQMRQEHKQRLEAQAKLEHTYAAMPIGLFTLDMQGRFLSANPALVGMLGANVLAPDRDWWGSYFNEGAWNRLLHLVQSRADEELEVNSIAGARSDDVKRFLVKATLANGKIEGSLQDVTAQSKATEDLRFMANNDPLTKVFNRRGIEKVLDSAVAQLAEGEPLALAYLDLDRFKLINDLYGHAAGDEVLRQVCERITGMLTGRQQVGRVGGDEFLIVFPDTAISLASWICHGIVGKISTAAYRVGDKAFQVRGSIGLIEISTGMPVKDAVSAADRACRDAKSGHNGGLVIYEKNAAAFLERKAELDLVERLSASAVPQGLFLEMQPIMSLKAPYASLNFEVLVRMRGQDGSVIPAGRIVAAAENSGRISVIDRWVLSTTLVWLNANYARLPRTQFVCMNLSGASLNDERFVQDAYAMLARHVHVAGRLCIEITESVALHDLDNTCRFIDKVRSFGAKIALDDFGAGYTSFSYLKKLPADVVKIDGSFIASINEHPANVAIVEAIVNLAMNLGMKTIAEWAEDCATVETLAEIGVDYVQGYAVARPQLPGTLLTATSSASFIQDEQLACLVRTLGRTAEIE